MIRLTALFGALLLSTGLFFTSSASAETQTVRVYDSQPGRTGHWWCENHFGGNLGGYWRCDGVDGNRMACDYQAPQGSAVQCTRAGGGYNPNPDIQQVRTYGTRSSGRTGQWWCDNHFGGNLGGYWQCLSVDSRSNGCYRGNLRTGSIVTCQRR